MVRSNVSSISRISASACARGSAGASCSEVPRPGRTFETREDVRKRALSARGAHDHLLPP